MRRSPVLLVAAVAALCLTPPASAHSTAAANQKADACPVPQVTRDYDGDRFSVHATLLASGCAAREHRQFSLSGFVSRVDDTTGEGHGRVVACGPFQSSSDMDPDSPPRTYSCDLDLSLYHPAVEAAHYEVEVTYPGADGDETVTFDSFCLSNEEGTSCSDEHPAT